MAFPVNPETDRLQIVSYSPVVGGNWLFPKSVSTDAGFSLQVFSPVGGYIGPVDAKTTKINAPDGSLIVRVNMGIKTYEFDGVIPTHDNFPRQYHVTIDVGVQSAPDFAIACRQMNDPVKRVRTHIENALNIKAWQLNHNEITPEAMRFWASTAAATMPIDIGMGIARVYNVQPQMHQYFVDKARKEAEQRAAQVAAKAAEQRAEWERAAKTAANIFARDEQKKADEAAREKALQDATVQDEIEITRELRHTLVAEYVKLLRDGHTHEAIRKINPLMAKIAEERLIEPRDQRVISSPVVQASLPGDSVSIAIPSNGTNSDQKPGWYNPYLGIRFELAGIALEDKEAISNNTRSAHKGYMVTLVESSSPVASWLAVKDIIVQVNGDPLDSEQPLIELRGSSNAQICFVRSRHVYEFNIASRS